SDDTGSPAGTFAVSRTAQRMAAFRLFVSHLLEESPEVMPVTRRKDRRRVRGSQGFGKWRVRKSLKRPAEAETALRSRRSLVNSPDVLGTFERSGAIRVAGNRPPTGSGARPRYRPRRSGNPSGAFSPRCCGRSSAWICGPGREPVPEAGQV